MAWLLRPSGGINEGTGMPFMDYVWDGNGTPTQSDYAQGYALANQAYQRDPSSINLGGGLMSEVNPDGTPRVSQSGGLDSFLGGPGAFLLAAGGLGGGALSAAGGMGASGASLASQAAPSFAGSTGIGNLSTLMSGSVGDIAAGGIPAAGTGAAMSGTSLDALFGPLPAATGGGVDLSTLMGGSVGDIAAAGGGAGTIDFTSPNSLWPSLDTISSLAPSGFDMSSLLKNLIPSLGTGSGLDLSKLLFGGGGVSSLFGNRGLVGTAASEVPGMLALDYASKQPGLNTGPLQGVIDQLSGNRNAVVKAATDPVNMNIAAGYGDLTQRLGNRGVLGSSFGNTDIANYLAVTGNTLGNVGANAAQGSLALQGNLDAQLAQLGLQNQNIKNSLYGRAFDVLGRGLNPAGYSGFGAIPTQ